MEQNMPSTPEEMLSGQPPQSPAVQITFNV